MRMDLRQQARLAQQMRMSPQMIQSMEILQLPLEELDERIEREVEENPALEFDDRVAAADPEDGTEGNDQVFAIPDDEAAPRREPRSERPDWEPPPRSKSDAGEPDPKMAAMANAPGRGRSAEEQMLEQWALAEVDPETAAIGALIISAIGPDGLLSQGLAEISAGSGGRVSEEALERVLPLVQEQLEPSGLAARDIRECLLNQLDSLAPTGAKSAVVAWVDARQIVAEYLGDFEANRIPRILRGSGMSATRLEAARQVLRHLDPAPGRSLNESQEEPVRVDVVVEYDTDNNRYVCALAEGATPTLRINRVYRQIAADPQSDPAARNMLRDGIRKGNWFIEAVLQRSSTLLRVVNEVVLRQRDWFDFGPASLKPLPMTELAAHLGLNVSTVSRAVAGKWMQTPRGVVELRRFFTGGTETDTGADLSWDAVRAMVRELVDAESKSKPLSDEAIAQALAQRGVTLARRTVVKYREQMGILSARLRKKH